VAGRAGLIVQGRGGWVRGLKKLASIFVPELSRPPTRQVYVGTIQRFSPKTLGFDQERSSQRVKTIFSNLK